MLIKKLDPFIIFIVGIILFTAGLKSQEILGFESRFYLFAQEMWRHGFSWFPTTYNKPYPDYPVTSTFLIYITSLCFNHLNKLTAVFPSAIISALTLSVTYLIGALQSRRWGWFAAMFLLLTHLFVTEARTISLDQFVTFFTALCFYLLMYSLKTKQKFFPKIISVILVLAFAIRGPIGIVIPTGVMCGVYLLQKSYRKIFLLGLLSIFLLFLCTTILLSLAYHQGGMSFVGDVLRMEVFGRMHDTQSLPFKFYFIKSFEYYAIVYPLAILTILFSLPDLIKAKSKDVTLLKNCLMWALVVLVGLSIPAEKKMRYILPMAPALALICGYLFVNANKNSLLKYLRGFTKTICFILPMLCMIGLFFVYKQKIALGLSYIVLVCLLILFQLAMIVMRKKDILLLGCAALLFSFMQIYVVEFVNLRENRTRDFVKQVEILREKNKSKLVFFHENPDGLPIKYIVHTSSEVFPQYIYSVKELNELPLHTLIIVGNENIFYLSPAANKLKVIKHGKIGHDKVSVLEKF